MSNWEYAVFLILAVCIGGFIGTNIGWDLACSKARQEHLKVRAKEVIVPHPLGQSKGIVFGTLHMQQVICEGH